MMTGTKAGTKTGIRIRIHMTDPLLHLVQWMSPSFPIGAFAYSSGLETEIAANRIKTAAHLEAWLKDICTYGTAQSDVVILNASYAASVEDRLNVDAVARAFCPSAERLKETDLQGAAFCDTVNALWSLDLPRFAYPVAVGAAAQAKQIPIEQTARVFLHATLSNLVSVAVRLVPLGQTEGQRVLSNLSEYIDDICADALATPLSAISSSAFASDIASMRHETLDTRIFRT
ncbi:MAG: urease accessory UreF family protein [Paracoccaceae bacterium]